MIFVTNATFALLLFSVCFAPQALQSKEIFKWIDDEGITHYSEDHPPTSVTEFKSLEFQNLSASGSSTPSRAAADFDYFSVINQAKRMEASRLARERLKLEQEKLRQKDQRTRQQTTIQDYTAERRSYSVVYPYYGGHYSIHPYRHKRYDHVPHHKNYGLSTRPIGRARHRLSKFFNSRHRGHRSQNARPRSIRLR